MADVQVKLNMQGLNRLMSSEPVAAEVEKRARRIANAAGDGFEVVVSPHKYSARAYVRTNSGLGRRREARDKVLSRAIDAGR